MREARNDAPRGGGRGGGDRGSSRGGYNRDFRGGDGNSGGYNKPSEEGGGGSKPFYEKRSVPGVYGGAPRGGRRGEAGEGERPRRTYERRSGTGRGSVCLTLILSHIIINLISLSLCFRLLRGDFKREGAGRGNWGTQGEEVLAV